MAALEAPALPISPQAAAPAFARGADKAQIEKTAKDFEAMVIGELLKPMFENLDSDGMFGGGQGEAMFRPMLVEQYAQKLSAGGGIGVAAAVAREMLALQAQNNGAPDAPSG
ncbi:MAG: rod-binding protein [Hyphomonadaceae bacterium]